MTRIYDQISQAKRHNRKLLSILLDPEKLHTGALTEIIEKLDPSRVDFLLVGGSTVEPGLTESTVKCIKEMTTLPVVLFPGDHKQVNKFADAVLFLNLLSGRNPEYLIEQQLKAVPSLRMSQLEVIPTAYLLIDGGVETAVQRVSRTLPMDPSNRDLIIDTACAGMYMGNKLIYLEAGSGARNPVSPDLISSVAQKTDLPIIVGGGIRSKAQLEKAFEAGADVVVIGTAFEENHNHLKKIFNDEHIH